MHDTNGTHSPTGDSPRPAASERYGSIGFDRAGVLADVVELAARIADVPVAAIVLVGDGASRLLAARDTASSDDLDAAMHDGLIALAEAIVRGDVAQVATDTGADAGADAEGGSGAPVGELVGPGIAAYSAAPLIDDEARCLGVIGVVDRHPRPFTALQCDSLTTFARAVVNELERRVQAVQLAGLEAARLAETTRFFQLAESIPAMVWTTQPNGAVDYASRAFFEYVGGDLDLAAWTEAVHPDDLAGALASWERARAATDTYAAEFRLRRHDGAYRWHLLRAEPVLDAHGELIAWFGSAIDFHDRREAEESLAAQERRLRAILDHEPECVKVVAGGGELVDMNAAGLRMVAAEQLDQLRGRVVADLIHPDDRAAFVDLHERVSRTGEPGTLRYRIIALDGVTRWAESHSVQLAEGVDGPPSVLSITRDVTARRRDELLHDAESTIFAMMASGTELDTVLERLVAALFEVNGGATSIMLVDHDHDVLSVSASAGLDDEYVSIIDGMDIGSSDGSSGAAAHGGEVVVVSDIDTDPRWAGTAARVRALALGLRACASTPVIDSSGRVIAVVAQYLDEAREPTDTERLVTTRAAQIAAVAIERLRTDAELRESTALVRFASRLSRLGGFTYDVERRRLHWSDEVAQLHGTPPGRHPTLGEALGFVVPEHREMVVDAAAAALADGAPYDLEIQIVPVGGVPTWCRLTAEPVRDAGGDIVRVVGAFQVIDGLKRAELALRENEERFRLLAEATSDVVFDWDLEHDSVWYGEGLEEMVGPVSGPLLVIDRIVRRIAADDRQRVIDRLRRAIGGTDELWTDDFRLVRTDGTEVAVQANGYVIRDADGRGVRLVGSLVDMTVQRELEQQLAQSQRLEAVGQLTGGIAHDFNNLLTVILGNSEMLIDDLADREPQRELAEMTRMAAERGAELTRRLLAFARRQPLAPSVVDVGSLLDDLHELLHRSIGEHIQIEHVRADDTWPALVDRSQLESSVLNVCLNARDAMPDGGRLVIEIANAVLDRGYAETQTELEPGEYVMIAISDTGSGMSADVRERAFDPFFTTKGPGRGSGLGLSMVYGFAKQSRGHVRMYSEIGEGTTVKLYVPRASRGVPEHSSRRTASGLVGGDETILLVEDDELVRTFATTQLRTLGYRVIEMADGRAALDVLEAGDVAVDLLFTDVVMPGGMNGRQLADAALERDPHLRVLFTSGYAESAIVHHGRLDRGVELLTKPYGLDDLAARVRQVIDGDVSGR